MTYLRIDALRLWDFVGVIDDLVPVPCPGPRCGIPTYPLRVDLGIEGVLHIRLYVVHEACRKTGDVNFLGLDVIRLFSTYRCNLLEGSAA